MSTASGNTPRASEPPASQPWLTWPVTIKRLRPEAPSVFTCELGFDQALHSQRRRHVPAVELSPRSARQNEGGSERDFLYTPGQFNMLYVPGVGEAAISIAGQSAADDQLLQHTIRAVGGVTRAIERGGVGMSLGLRGPFGRGWPIEELQPPDTKRNVILIAGGIGLAPLRSLIHHLAAARTAFGTVDILIGARTPQDLLYQDECVDWQANGIQVQTTVDRPSTSWSGHVGVVTLLLERLSLSDPANTLVMTCGPEVMMRYVAKSAIGRGIPEQHIWVALERNMNCAIGLCGHCQLGPEFICKDGPVFRYDRVRPWLRVLDL